MCRSNLSAVARKSPSAEPAGEANLPAEETTPDQIVFYIQVASSRNKTATDPSSFKGYDNIRVFQDGRWFKYLVDKEPDYNSILEHCKKVKEDFPDAFVVAIKNDKIIPLSEALEEINR